MVRINPKARSVDSKGRLVLGERFKNQTVLVEEREDELVIRLASVIPTREAWLYENKEALKLVRKGLGQARGRKFVTGPELKAAKTLADQLED